MPRLVEDPLHARLLAEVARAVHYATQQGFLHCDLKPTNILIDASGRPLVADFGLAKQIDGGGITSASGNVVGTPDYMAPEQAAAGGRELSAATNIYGLGATLYELLTGQPPFLAGTVMETVLQVLEREPPLPSQLRPGVPGELEAICLRCLEKGPGGSLRDRGGPGGRPRSLPARRKR